MRSRTAGVSIDFHVHTSYSYDSAMAPRLAIAVARRLGLSGIAVTDHDTIDGAMAALEANRHSDFLIIPGIEVKTNRGDVIGLFVERQISSRQFDEVIEEIHAQSGVVYIPHPIRTHGADGTKEIYEAHPEIDIWEMYNARYDEIEFDLSRRVFQALGTQALLCGSDAHFPWDVGVYRTVLTDLPRNAPALLRLAAGAKLEACPRGELVRSAGITLGAMTSAYKRRQYAKLAAFAARLPIKALTKSIRILGRRG
jgi:predicted metal-dependent phosphoesterase TrpH